jgi:hypothetical protein
MVKNGNEILKTIHESRIQYVRDDRSQYCHVPSRGTRKKTRMKEFRIIIKEGQSEQLGCYP